MQTNGSLFALPRFAFEIGPPAEHRVIGFGLIALVGMAIGGVAYLLSMALMPDNVTFPEHDLRLAKIFGFIYPPLVGLWASWVRRSVPWALFGVVSGLLIGAVCHSLCNENSLLAVAIAFPCLVGGCTSVALGAKHDPWIAGIPQLFLKGLVPGFVLVFVYATLLEVFVSTHALVGFLPSVAHQSSILWGSGIVAMIVSSSLYFLLFHWSAGLRPQTNERQRIG